MPITEEQRRAICRVYVPGAKRRGTGFLIAPDRVMTAAHVVCASDDERAPYAAADIELRFGNPGAPSELVKAVGAVVVESFSVDGDWAVIAVAGALANAGPPLVLRPLAPGYRVPWETYGYSEDDAVLGTAFEGRVVTREPRRMQLLSQVAGGLPPGVSGAPCIVDGRVVGIIVRAKSEGSSETFYAVCASLIGGAAVERGEAPYVPDVAQLLDEELDRYLDEAGKLLALPDLRASVARDRKPDVVADAMMRSGMRMALEPIARALGKLVRELAEERALEIAQLAARAWIDARAVARLREALAGGAAIAVVNTGWMEVGRWYVHRAGCAGEMAPGLFRYCLPVNVASVGDAAELRARIEAVLGSLEPPEDGGPFDAAAFLAAHPHDELPIVLVLPGVPPRAVLDAVRAGLPGLERARFVLLAGPVIAPAVRAEYAGAAFLEPELEESVAELAIGKRDAAVRMVKKQYAFQALGDV